MKMMVPLRATNLL